MALGLETFTESIYVTLFKISLLYVHCIHGIYYNFIIVEINWYNSSFILTLVSCNGTDSYISRIVQEP